MALVDQVQVDSIEELIDATFDAPYLSLWTDVSYLTPYGHIRPDSARFPVDKPELALSRHYGLPPRLAFYFWDRIEQGADDLLNPYARRKKVRAVYASRLRAVLGSRSGNFGPLEKLIERSIAYPAEW